MISSDLTLSTFALVVSLVTNLAIGLGAPYYLRRVRMERPAIGTFNRRDIVRAVRPARHAAGVLPAPAALGC